MRTIEAGQAEMPQPRGSAWARARQEQQLREWFGGGVDFLITLYALHAADRYGVPDLVRAARLGPTVAPARIAAACGTCLARAV